MTTALQGGGKGERDKEREREWKKKTKINRFRITITERPANYLRRREKKKLSHIQCLALDSETIAGKQEWERASVGSTWQGSAANEKGRENDSPLYCAVLQRDIWHNLIFYPFTPLHCVCRDSRRRFLIQVTIQGFHSRKPGASSRDVILVSTRLESSALLKLFWFMQGFQPKCPR